MAVNFVMLVRGGGLVHLMVKEASQKTRLQERRGSRKESEVQKRERILVKLLKCKMWECLEMKGRYQKRTGISLDRTDYEDAFELNFDLWMKSGYPPGIRTMNQHFTATQHP